MLCPERAMLRRVLHPRSVVTENNLPESGAEERKAKTGWVGEAEMADMLHSVCFLAYILPSFFICVTPKTQIGSE